MLTELNTEELHQKISQLQSELRNSEAANIQAAQYGLQVLEENKLLQQQKEDLDKKVENLQVELESAKHEFQLSTKALKTTQTKTKKAFSEGEIRETNLDTERIEAIERLEEVQRERDMQVHQLQTMLKSSNSEIERLSSLTNELTLQNQTLENTKIMFRKELKDMKLNEARLDSEYSELEEENCSLQKQVSVLRETQAEYEGLKYENRRMTEEMQFFNRELEELSRMKELLERQIEEAHETIQKERDIKLALKRELAQYENIDITGINIHDQMLDGSLKHIDSDGTDNSIENEHPLIRHITSDLIHNSSNNGNDLYSELNFSEISKLKQQLCNAEKQNVALINNLREQQVLMENKAKENKEKLIDDKENQMTTKLKEVQHELEILREKDRGKSANYKKLDVALKESIENNKYLQKDVERLSLEILNKKEEQLEANDNMQIVSDKLSHLYHRLCLSSGEIPQQVMLENARNESKASMSKSEENDENKDVSDASDERSSVLQVVQKQIEVVEQALDNFISANNNFNYQQQLDDQQETQEQMRALEEEVLRLRSLLSSKREQVATLRTVLKANKHTAEVAISNLKDKYQHEKLAISDTMVKLRGELKALKEDAITFARLRSVFAARTDEYVTQLDNMQIQLAGAEDEKRTLNTLLKKTIAQKLDITQKYFTFLSFQSV